jgi:hypothetical protein
LLVLLALLAFVLSATAVVIAALEGKPSTWSFGPFAGYIWLGDVRSVRASWTVPRVLASSAHSVAATWIAAAAPGSPANGIQIGTNEIGLPGALPPSAHAVYSAFWSDTAHHFHSQLLFDVEAGDNITASLARQGAQWELAIRDNTTGAGKRVLTTNAVHSPSGEAQWLQEDVKNTSSERPFPYPRLGLVGFRGLAVNGARPAYAQVYSRWMSLGGSFLAPTPLRGDSFTLGAASISLSGAHYLHIAARADSAIMALAASLGTGTVRAAPMLAVSRRASFETTLYRMINTVARVRWPLPVQGPIRSLITKLDVLLAHTKLYPQAVSGGVWASRWMEAAQAASRAAHMVRRALDIPESAPAI